MQKAHLARTWMVAALGAAVAGCALGSHSAERDLRDQQSRKRAERRETRDSVIAQRIADEVGPGVHVRVTLDNSSGNRRVEPVFSLENDAYVVIGHLGVDGRLSIVFPSRPDDDGLVRGGQTYRVPPFFVGFSEELAANWWRYRPYRSRGYATRAASYDGGLGYVFVVASWRPMRLDRIASGNRWEEYTVSDIQYLYDPREAIEELGAIIAGDNREAYTIEYASYVSTTRSAPMSYALNSFGRCSLFDDFSIVNWGFGSLFAYSPFAYGRSSGCSSSRWFPRYYASGSTGHTPSTAPIASPPQRRFRPDGLPRDSMGARAPYPGIDRDPSGSGRIRLSSVDQKTTRPGLFTVENGPELPSVQRPSEQRPSVSDLKGAERPSIQDMVGRGAVENMRTQHSAADPFLRPRLRDGSWSVRERTDREDHSYSGGLRAAERVGRDDSPIHGDAGQRAFSPASGDHLRRGGDSNRETRMSRPQPRGESSDGGARHSPASTPARSGPAPRSEPASRPAAPSHPAERPTTTEVKKPGR